VSAASGAAAHQVLVAEDEIMFRNAAVESLKACGFKVFQAGDGQEALGILKAHPEISLLVSDVRMPGVDGYALVEASLVLNPNLKVILMTGYVPSPPKLVLDHEIGILRKPFDTNVLCHHAEDLVRLN
jgi:CheY-like chemotaxis protein